MFTTLEPQTSYFFDRTRQFGLMKLLVQIIVAFAVIMLTVAAIEWVIKSVFQIDIGLTKKLAETIANAINVVINALVSPFKALQIAVISASWRAWPLGLIILVMLFLVIIYGMYYFIVKRRT